MIGPTRGLRFAHMNILNRMSYAAPSPLPPAHIVELIFGSPQMRPYKVHKGTCAEVTQYFLLTVVLPQF